MKSTLQKKNKTNEEDIVIIKIQLSQILVKISHQET